MTTKSLYGGWPLVIAIGSSELTLTCPGCGSQNITLTGCYAARGTAPGGRGRLGDPGSQEWAECNQCGKRGYLKEKAHDDRSGGGSRGGATPSL